MLTKDKWLAVLDAMADGMSTRKACETLGISRKEFWRTLDAPDSSQEWPGTMDSRRQAYAGAAQASIRSLADDTMALADSAPDAESNTRVQGLRLAVDTRRWLLSKIAPKNYGDRVDVEHGGSVILQLSKDDVSL